MPTVFVHGSKDTFATSEELAGAVRQQALNFRRWVRAGKGQAQALARADPARKKEEIRIASIEADCNEKTQLTQRLGDIEASYQAPLIKQNEAALQDVKAETAKHVDAARAYLASHQ